jgi:hypothetical protein
LQSSKIGGARFAHILLEVPNGPSGNSRTLGQVLLRPIQQGSGSAALLRCHFASLALLPVFGNISD